MAVVNKAIDKQSLKGLSPLGKLTPDKIDDIITKSRVENLPAGRIIFRQGDSNDHKIYLLSGQIELSSSGKTKKKTIKSKSVEAKFPIADETPRPVTARTKTASSLLYIDASLLEILLDENPSGEYEVTEINIADHASGWMMRFLQSRAFLKLPTENIQKVLMSMEEVAFNKGEIVIQQGDEGDYYYIIKKGQCSVTRRPAEKVEEVRLALLAEGDGFGEEALITNGKRNATIKMVENGTLMRLRKENFLSLLVNPLIRNVHLNSLKNDLYKHSIVIDIRSHDEFKSGSLNNAKHIPLSMMRLRVPTLDNKRQYLVYSENKDDACAASFMLAQHGIECCVILGSLKQGMQNSTKISHQAEILKNESAKKEISTKPTIKNFTDENSVKKVLIKNNADIQQGSPSPVKPKHELQLAVDNNQQKKDVEKLHQEAKKQAELMLAEAEEVRQSAIKEALRLKEQVAKEETLKLREELENTRSRAEAAIHKTQQLAEKIRQQAEQESSQIRQQAETDAEKLRQEIEQLRQEEAQMKLQLESEILRIRQEAAEQAKLEAEQEAEKARLAAAAAAEQAREMAAREAEKTRAEAQKAAEKARQKAISQAEATLAAAEQAAADAQATADKLTEQAKVIEREAESARRRAEEEAMAIRQAAMDEANRIKQTALKESRRLKDKETTRSIISHDNVFDLDDEIGPTIKPVMPFADEASMAMKMAKEIKAKLLEVEEQRRVIEQQEADKPNKHQATLTKLEGKVILEGEDDLFIFKEPKKQKSYVKTFNDSKPVTQIADESKLSQINNQANSVAQALPTAETGNAESNFNFVPNMVASEHSEEDKNTKSLLTIAASIILVVALSLVAYTTKIQINFTEVRALVNKDTIEEKEDLARKQAREEFRKKVSTIKK